jgi:hypothetical protein
MRKTFMQAIKQTKSQAGEQNDKQTDWQSGI